MPCGLCEPAPHPNCETYSEVKVMHPATGEETWIDVCLEHLEAIQDA